jgi:hypothetical protein
LAAQATTIFGANGALCFKSCFGTAFFAKDFVEQLLYLEVLFLSQFSLEHSIYGKCDDHLRYPWSPCSSVPEGVELIPPSHNVKTFGHNPTICGSSQEGFGIYF